MRYGYVLISVFFIGGCSLFGPPLPPAKVGPEVAEFEAAPGKSLNAFVECARNYAAANAAAHGVTAEAIVDAAIYACRKEQDDYREIAADRSRGYSRVLGLVDRSKAYTDEAVEKATAEVRLAAMDAVIRSRANRSH